ncbi:unnamed protein product [Protopolystoma xenopodis]|uniref:Uncharacterized protein n=1 Tax=Protopolystoma xenopodis TaxID=117903 RepID=A0A3S5CBR8_9PLAT|nr:unnamed protein product [Protopolystoma xenopodis]
MKESTEKSFDIVLIELRTGVVFFTFSLALAPILHSLLDTVSTDSIHALAFCLLLVNWITFDYPLSRATPFSTTGSRIRQPGSDAISLTAALLASLCLASRLPGPLHTFVLVSVAIALFALWPLVSRRFRVQWGDYGELGITLLLGMTANLLAWHLNHYSNLNKFSSHEREDEEASYQWMLWFASFGTPLCLNFIGPFLFWMAQSLRSLASSHFPFIPTTLFRSADPTRASNPDPPHGPVDPFLIFLVHRFHSVPAPGVKCTLGLEPSENGPPKM